MDIIQSIFKTINFNANIYLHSAFCSPWGVESSHPGLSSFHVIAYGNCELHIEGKPVIHLSAGDLIFFARNTPHRLINPNEEAEISTTLICGKLSFDNNNNPILLGLPPYLHIKANQMDEQPWLKTLFQQIVSEAESQSEGRQLVLDKLAEILFIYIVRYYLATDLYDNTNKSGLLKGLSNPAIARSLLAFHTAMDKPWTLDSLAEAALISRSKFASLFNQLLAITPLKYMTYWRMQQAKHLLENTDDSIYLVALSCGYRSEASFIKVFKKHFGNTPGKARQIENKEE
ncbi:AraC family transcriptional regulator [Marinicella sp. S1101]|uniref:AraC family transcriptional regulator n=1 Tax=Marinicella marina TaxID=2996016 RepID=UPI0022609F8C|nr:AraC family transcriptional regulator [Marinicella marina]MCX7554158.1 AraC family transcriptional regulator [Marinicella marina]MDJ1141149.1 AraC family transcriptional regulator [Marinicella marina]